MGRYSIWVLEYACSYTHPVSATFYGAHNEGTLKLPFAYVLIKGPGVVAMVDVGYNNIGFAKEFAESIGVGGWHSPQEVLGECDVSPEDVTHVFLTHAHFDHAGGTALFPNARFFIQERELTGWVAAMALPRRLRTLTGGIDPGDVIRLVELAKDGRLTTVPGAQQDVVPGIDLHPAFDSHTPGSQYLVVRNSQGSSEDVFVLAGDLIYKYENLNNGNEADPAYVPVGLATGSQWNLVFACDEMLRTVGGNEKRIVPMHESRLAEFYPSRTNQHGLQITEIALGEGEPSRVS